jgi:LysR family transcriptional regulator, nitrogen assimilation regulatory protein
MAAVTKGVIDSRRLLLFYHVAQAGSLSKAEATLFIPQPAISRHLSRLEEDLGVKLLERHGRGVALTSFGEILFRQAETILQDMALTLEEIDLAKHRPVGKVSISASSVVMSMFMPDIVRRFINKFPEVELTAIQAISGEVYNQLVSGRVDVAIVMQVPTKHKFGLIKLLEEPMYVVVSKSHKLGAQTGLKRAELRELELALPTSPNGMRGIIDNYLAAGNVELRPHLQMDSVPLTAEILLDGRFGTIMPASSIAREFSADRYTALPLAPALTRTLYAARRQEEGRSPYVDALMDIVSEVFAEAGNKTKSTAAPATKKPLVKKPG